MPSSIFIFIFVIIFIYVVEKLFWSCLLFYIYIKKKKQLDLAIKSQKKTSLKNQQVLLIFSLKNQTEPKLFGLIVRSGYIYIKLWFRWFIH